MILVIKYDADNTTLFDRADDNGTVTAIDAILIEQILDSSFPIFSIKSESAGVSNERKAGEWGGTFSFLQSATSTNDDNINEFFRGATRDSKYIILMSVGSTIFHGMFKCSDLNYDFTYSEGKYEVTFLARDLLEEWAVYLSTLTSKFSLTGGTQTFEFYMASYQLRNFHVNFIGETLSTRIGQEVVFDGSIYNAIGNSTDWRGVARLDTLKGLARGLGFTYDLSVFEDLEDIANDSNLWSPYNFLRVNIDWLSNTSTQNALRITQTKVHTETSLTKSTRYLFIGYRNIISTAFPGFDEVDFTAVRGILFDGESVVAESDSIDNGNPIYAQYPFFYFPLNPPIAPDGNLLNDWNFAFYDRRYPYPEPPPIYNNADVTYVGLPLYNGGFAGTVPGSVAYARTFRTVTSGFLPVQRFAVEQYKRYLLQAGKKVKTVRIIIESSTTLKLFNPVVLTDDQGEGTYYISKISNLDYQKRDVTLELTQI